MTLLGYLILAAWLMAGVIATYFLLVKTKKENNEVSSDGASIIGIVFCIVLGVITFLFYLMIRNTVDYSKAEEYKNFGEVKK